jgi:hypothetical protein
MATQLFSSGQGEANLSYLPAGAQQTRNAGTKTTDNRASSRPQQVRWRTVALPVEHGGWGLALEPVVLGLCVAPTMPGAFLALATVAAFLTRHPLKLAVGDRRRGRRFPRTPVAERFALAYASVALVAFLLALTTAPRIFLLPLAVAAPCAVIQLVYDALGRSRALLPELSGATALAAVPASIALAAGWLLAPAFALWAVLAATRVVPSILYVRTRLRKNHGKPSSVAPALSIHLLGCALALVLAQFGLIPLPAIAAAILLLLRAAFALSPLCPQVTAKQIGFSEIAFGLITILTLAFGYALKF